MSEIPDTVLDTIEHFEQHIPEPIFVRFGVAGENASDQNQTGDAGGLNIAA